MASTSQGSTVWGSIAKPRAVPRRPSPSAKHAITHARALATHALPVAERVVGLRTISAARDARELAPGLSTGMAIGADVPAAEPPR